MKITDVYIMPSAESYIGLTVEGIDCLIGLTFYNNKLYFYETGFTVISTGYENKNPAIRKLFPPRTIPLEKGSKVTRDWEAGTATDDPDIMALVHLVMEADEWAEKRDKTRKKYQLWANRTGYPVSTSDNRLYIPTKMRDNAIDPAKLRAGA